MTISVVIATYNRSGLLAGCLRSLADQLFEDADEVVVVDNGSTDDTSRAIETARARFPVPVRHLSETRPGKTHAIAAALAVAAGDVLAFTDDDVMVEADWLSTIRRVMRDSNAALVGGPVMPRWETKPPRWLRFDPFEYGRLAAPLGLLNYGPSPLELGPRTVLGANMAVRRAPINKVGGFATNLGKLRGTLLSGEDHELCQRVQSAGFKAMYVPELRVSHWVPAERMRASYSMSWFFWSGITHATLDAAPASNAAVRGLPRHYVKRALTSGIRGIGAAVLGRPAHVMDSAIDVAFVAGYAARRWNLKGEVQL
jgi:glucosyl-dolichyl phosphate glucuronosyltransferase